MFWSFETGFRFFEFFLILLWCPGSPLKKESIFGHMLFVETGCINRFQRYININKAWGRTGTLRSG